MGWLFLFQSVGSRARTFRSCSPWALEHRLNSCGARLSCYAACGIFWDQGLNPCLLHWQVMLYHWATREALHVPFYQTLKNRLSGPTFSLIQSTFQSLISSELRHLTGDNSCFCFFWPPVLILKCPFTHIPLKSMYWCSLDILFMLHSPQQAHLHLQIILPPTWHGLWKQHFHPANSLFIAYWQSPFEYLFHSHLNHIISCVQNLTSAPCILLCHPLSSPQGSWQGFLQGLTALPSAQSRNITNLSQFNLHSFICALIQEFLPLILIIRMALYLWSFTPNFSLLPYPPFTQLSR